MSYTNLMYHIVFSTKGRKPMILPEDMPRICQYIGGIIREMSGSMIAANGPADHVHIAALAAAKTAVADFVRTVKTNSSRWIHKTLPGMSAFAWQDGYAAFSVSRSGMSRVVNYVRNQVAQHAKMTFEEELIALLSRHGIRYDERYLWA